MLWRDSATVLDVMLEQLEFDKDLREAADEFESTIIKGYERALDKGLTANLSLSVLLAWAAKETARVQKELSA